MSKTYARKKAVVEKEVPNQPGKTYLAAEIPQKSGGTISSDALSRSERQYDNVRSWADRYNSIMKLSQSYRPGDGDGYLKDIQRLIGDYNGIRSYTDGSLNGYWKNLLDLQKVIYDTERLRGQFDSEEAYNKYVSEQKDYESKRTADLSQLEQEIAKLEKQYREGKTVSDQYQSLYEGTPWLKRKQNPDEYEALRKKGSAYLRDEITNKKSFLNEARAIQERERLEGKYGGKSYQEIQDLLGTLDPAGQEAQWARAYAETVMRPEDYSDQILKNTAELKYLEEGLQKIQGLSDQMAMGGETEADKEKYEALLRQYGSPQDLKNQIEALNKENWKYQNALKYGSLNENEDYRALSTQVSDVKKAGIGIGFGTKWWGQGDPVYRYINNIDGAREVVQKGKTPYSVYDFMTDEDIANYNYLYNAQGKKAAQEYLDYLSYDLEHRQQKKLRENAYDLATDHPYTASALSVLTNLGSGIGALDVAGQNLVREISGEYKPIHYERGSMAPTAFTTTIRGTVAQNIADATGIIELDEEGHPFWSRVLNGKSLGDVYQLGMSMVDSTAVAALAWAGIPGGTALLGGSAASQGVLDALEKGASDSQALSMGILNGTFEMLFEEVSLDKLLKGSTGSIIKDILQQGGVEGSEEFLTTLANTAADILVMADKSGYQSDIERYMREDGLDRKQATLKALQNVAIGMGWDFVGGFLSGGAMGGMAMPIHTYVQGASLQKAGVSAEELSQLGETFYQDSKTGKMVGKAGNDSGAFNMGRLYNRISTELSNQNAADIQKALEEKGMDRAIAKKHAQILETIAEGGTLSDTQMRMIEKNEILSQAMEEIIRNPDSTVNQRLRGYKDIVHKQQAIHDQDNGSRTEQTHPGQENTSKPAEQSIHNLVGKAVDAAVSEDGKTRIVSTGQDTEIQKIASIRDGNITFQMEDGSLVDAGDIAYGSEGDAIIYDAVASLGVRAEMANLLVDGFTTSKDVPAAVYAKGMQDAFRYGKWGAPMQEMERGVFTSQLTEHQRQQAYEIGRMTARLEKKQTNMEGTVNETKEAGAGVYLRQGVQRDYGSDSGGQVRTVEAAAGGVQNRQGEAQGRSGNGGGSQKAAAGRVSTADLGFDRGSQTKNLTLVPATEKSRTLDGARAVAKKHGMDIVLFRGGNLEMKDQNGKTITARACVRGNTMYVRADHKGFSPEQLARHEAGHKQIERGEISPKQVYDKLASIYVDSIEEILPDGTTVTKSQCIDYMIEQYAIAYQLTDMTSEEVWEEIVCDSLADMNAFSPETARQAVYFLADIRQEAQKQRAETKAQRTGPPDIVKYSIDPAYAAEIDMWDKNGRPDGEMFVLGSTGGVLQGLGAMEQDIFLRSEKVNTIMREHPEMTLEEIRRIPEILDDPTLVLKSQGKKSKGNNSRLVMFGSVYTQAKQPVLSVLDLRPMENGISIDDMQKVSSSYVKTSHPDTFVQNSDVLYADKKRTIQLLRSIGLTISSRELLPDGYIGNITYSGKKVNINGIPFREAFSGKYGSRFSRENPTVAELQRENTLLRQRLEYWMGQTKLTERKTVRLADVDKVAKDTLAKYQSEADFGKVRNAMKYLADDMRNLDTASITGFDMDALSSEDSFADMRESPVWDKLQARAEGIAETILDGSKVQTNEEVTGFVKDLRDFLKGRKISLEKNKSDISDYNDFRKRNFGRFTLSDSGTPMDTMWMELQEQFGKGFFPEDITHPADQALYVEQWLSTAPEYSNPYQADFRDNAIVLANEILDDLFSDAVRDTAPTFADRQTQKLTLEQSKRAMADERLKKTVQEMDEKIQKSRNTIEKLRKEKNQMRKEYQDSRAKSVEGRKKTIMRHKLQSDVKELDKLLNHGDKKRNVKEGMRDFATEALATAEFLFSDEYSNEDMVRAGVMCDVDARENKILEETQSLLQQYDDIFVRSYAEHEVENIIAGDTESFDARMRYSEELNRKIAENMRKLNGVFSRERNRLNKATVSSMLDNLAKAYKKLGESDELYIRGAANEEVYQHLLDLSDSIGGTIVKDMNLKQLTQLHEAYTMVLTTIRNANKSFKAARNATVQELSQKVMAEVSRAGGNRQYSIPALEAIEKFGFNNLKPVYAFELMGSDTFKELFKNVRKGEDIWAVDVNEARDFFLEQAKKYGYFQWDIDKRYSFTSATGEGFDLGLGQMMILYALSKRKQSADHIRKGGVVNDENIQVSKKTKLGITMKFNPADATAYNISDETMVEIIGKLAKEHKDFVDAMQGYLSEVMGEKGNEVSLQLYGIKLFGEKDYFPLLSAQQYMAKAKEQKQGERKIKNAGFTKHTVEHAGNPVVLGDFMDVWAEHVNEMSMYHAFVLPMEDFYRVWNYNTGNTDTEQSRSVNATVQNAFGTAATGYIDQLLKDLNGGARADPTTGIISKGMNLFKKGAVFASASVVIQQPSAIGRALAMIDMKYFAGPRVTKENYKNSLNQMKKYAPVAVIKEMGYFDTNMGKSTKDYILGQEYEGFGEKAKAFFTDSGYRDEALSRGAALADEITWCNIWEAVKRETKAKHPDLSVRSETFLQMAGERFTDVIVKTQVYDSVLSRSGNMRSKDTGMKMATAFMAEPTTSMNMIVEALVQGKRGGIEGRRHCRRAIGAVAAAQIINSVLVSFVYAARDDDEDETYLEKYVEALTGGLLDSLNPATYIPFLKDIMSIVQGYSVERSDIAVFSDLWKAWEQLGSKTLSPWRKVEGFVGSLCQIFGLPVKNIMRDARGCYQLFESIIGPEKNTLAGAKYAIKEGVGEKASIWEQMYDAYAAGDQEHLDRVEDRYIRNSNAPNERQVEKKMQSGFKNYLKDQYVAGKLTPEEAKDALTGYLELDSDEANEILNQWQGVFDTGNTLNDENDGYLREEISGEEYVDYLVKYGGKSQEEAETAEKKLRCERDEGFAYGDLREMYAEDKITKEKAMDCLQTYGDYSKEEAEQYMDKLEFEKKYGFAYDNRRQAYLNGEVSGDELQRILVKEGGYTAEDAAAQVEVYEWEKSGIKGATKEQIATYNTNCKSAGVSIRNYMEVVRFKGKTHNDVDENGKSISYSAVRKVMAKIDSLPISDSQKEAIAHCFGWKERTIQTYRLW